MRSILEDLRYSLRALNRQRGIPLLLVLTLAAGIGANTAVFNLIDALILRPLPYSVPERLVTLHETERGKGSGFDPISAKNLSDWRREARGFDAVGAFRRADYNLSVDDRPEWVRGAQVEASLFPLLGIRPILGRGFAPEEDRPGGRRVVLLSHALWRERFASDPKAVGRTVRVDGVVHEVIGVMPERFGFPEWARAWTPLALDPLAPDAGRRDEKSLSAMARLAPGVSVAQAQSSLDEVARSLAARYPETNRTAGALVRPLGEELMPREARLGLLLLLGAAGFVLLIICSNSTTLLVVRITARVQELAVRAALGAPRVRLLRQLVFESLVLFLLAGGLAVGASIGAVRLMLRAVPVEIPFWVRLDLDARVLVFTLGVSLIAGLGFGLIPALRATRPASLLELRGLQRGSSAGKRQSRLRLCLVAGELALSGVLLICSMLLVKSSLRMADVDRGYRAESVLTSQFSLTAQEYDDPAKRHAFADRLLEATRALPGVESAGLVDFLPESTNGFQGTGVVADDRPVERGEEVQAARNAMAGAYLDSLRIPLLAGRPFTSEEVAEGKPAVIVSDSLAQKLWPGREALGRRLRLTADAGNTGSPGSPNWLTVVGVAGDIRPAYPTGGAGLWPRQQVYLPLPRSAARTLTLAVRSQGPPAGVAAALRETVHQLDPHLPLFHVLALPQVQAELEWLPRFWSRVFSVFAFLGVAIAAVGLFGLVAHSVAERGRELGIRAALGAGRGALLLLPVQQGLRLAGIGLALGVGLAFGMAQLLRTLLYGVRPTDPWVFGGVSALLVAIALIASLVPALRILRLDPVRALKGE